MLRTQAEMENLRKRQRRELENAHKFALDKIAMELLPVCDTLEMGVAAASAEEADVAKILEGSELTLKMLTQALEKFNIVEVNPLGGKFDPDLHQAISTQEGTDNEANTVINVLQKGYTLNERLLRPAMVIIAK
jgi:molecular chaperone GrpE